MCKVDFLLSELHLPPGTAFLDFGCGTSLHSIELAKRGYIVTGLDLSLEMLSRAAEAARIENVQVEWIHSNAAQFTLLGKYDAAICLCEGASETCAKRQLGLWSLSLTQLQRFIK